MMLELAVSLVLLQSPTACPDVRAPAQPDAPVVAPAPAPTPVVVETGEADRPVLLLRLLAGYPSGGGLTVGVRPTEHLDLEGGVSTWLVWWRAWVDVGYVFRLNARPSRTGSGVVFSLIPTVGYGADYIPVSSALLHGPRARLKFEATEYFRGRPGLTVAVSGGAALDLAATPPGENFTARTLAMPEAAVEVGWAF